MSTKYTTPEALERSQARLKMIEDSVSNAGLTFDKSERTLVFYAARFMDRPDKVGDVIDPSAFNDWRAEWAADPKAMYPATGGKLPIVIAHRWDEPENAYIGWAEPDDVTVDTKGLLIAAHLFPSDEARKVWELAKNMGDVGGGIAASFAFDVVAKAGSPGEYRHPGGHNVLTRLAVIEAGPCGFGAEPAAGTVAVKSADRALAEWKALEATVENSPSRRRERFKDASAIFDGITAETNSGAGSTDSSLIVGPDYSQTRCANCQSFLTKPPRKNPGGFGYLHTVCEKCEAINFIESDLKANDGSMLADWQIDEEAARLFKMYEPRSKMPDHLRRDAERVKRALKRNRERAEVEAVFAPPRTVEPDYDAEILQLEVEAFLAGVEGIKARPKEDDLSEWTAAARRFA
jgi:hypothetical protein